eukprot:COSAG01_NODE_798_length_13503_cov_8.878395_10_plen_102_part_00
MQRVSDIITSVPDISCSARCWSSRKTKSYVCEMCVVVVVVDRPATHPPPQPASFGHDRALRPSPAILHPSARPPPCCFAPSSLICGLGGRRAGAGAGAGAG